MNVRQASERPLETGVLLHAPSVGRRGSDLTLLAIAGIVVTLSAPLASTSAINQVHTDMDGAGGGLIDERISWHHRPTFRV